MATRELATADVHAARPRLEHRPVSTRPAWVLAGASILMSGVLMLGWSNGAAADCAASGAPDAACQDVGPREPVER